MRSRKSLVYFALAILIVPLLAACGGPTKIDAALTTFKITLSQDSAKAGDIVFHVHNDATDLKHEFVIFKTDLAPDALPMNSEGAVDENGAGVTHIDEVEVEPGQAADLKVNLQPGNYVLICNINDNNEEHYQHGMYVGFTVK
ncbi:MAG: hypothetical protein C3F07_06520 [Anaerolineales bacterium]|nr:hypothetical protein [Anaerolineae bacterium]PWB75092.1 MAG: hypothetical protein C3F07_06520 [Anaerolineales bacterium]